LRHRRQDNQLNAK